MIGRIATLLRGHGTAVGRFLRELSGAVADLGVLLPYALGAIIAGLLPAAGVLAGFGAAYVATGLIYRLPIAVQPMKAVGAVALSGGLTGAQIVLSGIAIGICLLVLGASGAARRMARLLPQSVTSGLQLGLGAMLALFALSLMAEAPWQGLLAAAMLLALGRVTACPSALIVVAGSALLAALLAPADAARPAAFALPGLSTLSWNDLAGALASGVLPQLPLTLVNAVVVTAALARELFPESGRRVTETRLALTSGCFNLALCPLGAMPMCHGAGGLAAHHRFGARSGLGIALLGGLLLVLAAVPSGHALLSLVPLPVVGALLLLAAIDLAASPRILDATPSCKAVIALTAAATALGNPAVGLAVGLVSEPVRRRLVRALLGSRQQRRLR